jgi:membrane protein required for beta-lactamase induction
MTLRPRRNVVLWRQSDGPAGRTGAWRVTRTTRIPRWMRTGALLAVIGLMALARGAWARRRLLLTAAALIAIGVVMRSGPGAIFLLPGLMLLLCAPLMNPPAKGRRKLERELAAYSTPAERRDLEATLDQYPDDMTRELRDILASQASAARRHRIAAFGRH